MTFMAFIYCMIWLNGKMYVIESNYRTNGYFSFIEIEWHKRFLRWVHSNSIAYIGNAICHNISLGFVFKVHTPME